MSPPLLRRLSPKEVPSPTARGAVDAEALETTRPIVDDVRRRGEVALREHCERLGDLTPDSDLFIHAERLARERSAIPRGQLELLERTADRIRRFAEAQRATLSELEIAIPGGRAGHQIAPVERAGCYAPGGRFPLPSTVLMTAVTARAAGVDEVWVASPKPGAVTLAAAAVAGADGLVAAGGAQAIAALSFGAGPLPPCDAVVGPGNRYVTAAKQLVAGQVTIDMLAGPSELVVLADASADPAVVAADLIAQAEHDPAALPALITTDAELIDQVEAELAQQLADLPTASTARPALAGGFAVVAADLDQAVELCNRLAPEHLELQLEQAAEVADRCQHYGGLFIGAGAAEVLGDYGAGPNHTLPTGGTARSTGGLSVLTFLRVRTWLQVDDPEAAAELAADAEALAELEGLAGHGRSAARRR